MLYVKQVNCLKLNYFCVLIVMKSSVEFVSLGASMYTAIAVLIPPTIFFVKTLMETNHQPPSSVFNKFFHVRFQCGGSPQTIFSL